MFPVIPVNGITSNAAITIKVRKPDNFSTVITPISRKWCVTLFINSSTNNQIINRVLDFYEQDKDKVGKK